MHRIADRPRRARVRFLSAAATVAAILTAIFGGAGDGVRADAITFTPDNLVIYRVGTGTGSLVNTGNPVFVDEYTPTGLLVQSIPLPATASGTNFPLIASGTATSEGLMTRSEDGMY